jgi:hypothetical protein
MLTALWSAPFAIAVASEISDGGFLHGGRLFHFARLVAALLAATLIPILIDHRLRR